MNFEPIGSAVERQTAAKDFEAWLHDPAKFPDCLDDPCGEVPPCGDPSPQLARALRFVVDEIIYAGDRARPPTVRRAWSGFVCWLALMDVPVFAEATIDQLSAKAAVSKPTLIARLRRLSAVTGIPLRERKCAEHCERIAESQRARHARRAAA